MDFDAFFAQPLVMKVVRAMAKTDPTPLTFRQFTEASGYFPEAAMKLRDAMAAWNLITVKTKGRRQEIRLTQYGRDLNEITNEVGKLLEKAARAKARESPSS